MTRAGPQLARDNRVATLRVVVGATGQRPSLLLASRSSSVLCLEPYFPLCPEAASKKLEEDAVFVLFAPGPVNADDLDDLVEQRRPLSPAGHFNPLTH